MSEHDDSLIQSFDPPIKLPVFEGPLDLLLFLIRKNEIDIYDIPIVEVTRQYLDVLHSMETLSLEIAGEFFVMAAQLMYIKSRLLLPQEQRPEVEDDSGEDADPRWELVQQLLEYKQFKESAEALRDCIERQQDYLPRHFRQADEENRKRELKPSDKLQLWNTFNLVLRRLAEKIQVGEIHDESVTVADRMEFVLGELEQQREMRFSQLVSGEAITLTMLVATFLAVLELTRLGMVEVAQEVEFADIRLTFKQTQAVQAQADNDDGEQMGS